MSVVYVCCMYVCCRIRRECIISLLFGWRLRFL